MIPFLTDIDLEYRDLPWNNGRGEGQVVTLLCPPNGEPYVAIAELVGKVQLLPPFAYTWQIPFIVDI